MRNYDENYEEQVQNDLKIVWKCDNCGDTREEYPNCNEGGICSCGGVYQYSGESYEC